MKRNVPTRRMRPHPDLEQLKRQAKELLQALVAGDANAVAEVNARLEGSGRVLVRPSGTEPLVRVLAEAETPEIAMELCATIADLVTRELG